MRLIRVITSCIVGASAMITMQPIANAQAWPDYPIRFIVPFAAGGANDLIARAVAEVVSKRIGQPIVSKEAHDKLIPSGIEPAAGPLPQFIAFINNEHDRLGLLIKTAGMTAE